jgi:hypothetical protein
LAVVLLASASAGAEAQVHASITGVVYDSIGRTPLRGAEVQLVATDSPSGVVRTVISDSAGRFRFDSVAAGSHLLGFIHAILDSLGLEPIGRKVEISEARVLTVDLAVPSTARMRTIVCGRASSGGLILGVVRDARTHSGISGVLVTARWLEIAISTTGIATERHSAADTTHPTGWFALCDVPGPGRTLLVAHQGADSTDAIDVNVSDDGFLRRDLYIGAAADAPTHTLSGTVMTAGDTSRPIAGARVRLAGAEVEANDRGEWTLTNVRAGTRVLQVRAVGHVPEQRVVDVVAGTPPVYVALYTNRAMLDTIKVTAARLSANMRGFDSRRRAGMGRFLTAEEITERRPAQTSDLFRMMPGLDVGQPSFGQKQLVMRDNVNRFCNPVVYLNSVYFTQLSADELDALVDPLSIVGIEVYRPPFVPPQFSMGAGDGGCGAIVIWTARGLSPTKPMTWKRRIAVTVAILVLITGIATLMD